MRALLSLPIQSELPAFLEAADRAAYTEAGEYVAALLRQEVPALRDGALQIVAIARRPGVITKVALRPGLRRLHSGVHTSHTVGGDHLARVRDHLDGERIDVIAWHASAPHFIAAALGLPEVPPTLLLPGIAHARVLVGDIDLRGLAGWRGLNVLLASAVTGWRIRLESVATTDTWRHLSTAMHARRAVRATAIDQSERGTRVDVLGLFATLPGAALEPGSDLAVRITRMDPDEGRIFVSDRLAPTGQLPLL